MAKIEGLSPYSLKATRRGRCCLRAAATAVASVFVWVNVVWPAIPPSEKGDKDFWSARRQKVVSSKKPSASPRLADGRPGWGAAELATPLSAVHPDPLINTGTNLISSDPARWPAWVGQLPLAFIRLGELHSPAGRPDVVIVNDLHGQRQAQENIAAFLTELASKQPRGLTVAVEGAAGDIDFSPYRELGSDVANRRVAEAFLNRGWIQGVEMAGLTGPSAVRYVGVEDPALYLANVEAYRRAVPLKGKMRRLLAEQKKTLDALKENLYTAAQRKADVLSKDYAEKRIDTGAYVDGLLAIDGQRGAARSPEIQKFVSARLLERRIDLSRAEADRAALVQRLSEVLPARSLEDWIQATLRYRLGQMEHGDYYRFVLELAARAGVEAKGFPHFYGYARYCMLVGDVNRERFFDELVALEERVWRNLGATPEQAELRRLTRQADLVGKMADQGLTDQEWRDYQVQREDIEKFDARLARLGAAVVEPFALDDLRTLEEFYVLAL
ncbi:MAG TPA: hypothetical protein P5079_11640, partial [Elusimicrobiota bacterium]|nr:hypothetical protein [Elusimicrobiota bacterium]